MAIRQDPAAERAVLAAVYHHGSPAYDDARSLGISAESFTDASNQVVWRCLERLVAEDPAVRPDVPAVYSAANSLGLGEFFGSPEEKKYLRALANLPVRGENTLRMAAKVRKLQAARVLRSAHEQSAKALDALTGDEPIDAFIAASEGRVLEASASLENGERGPQLMGDGVGEYVEYLLANPREMMGVPTGLPEYDAAIGGGVRPNSLNVIAARPKQGKTMLVDCMAIHIAGTLGVPVFNADTEMNVEEHRHRVLANMSGVPIDDIETGRFGKNPDAVAALREAAARLAAMPYTYECVIGKTFEQVLSSLRRWVTRTVGIDPDTGMAKPCVLIYDYLKLPSPGFMGQGDKMQEYQSLGYLATGLKDFMGRYGVGSICFAQQNREGIDGDDTDTIAGSDRIVHYCTSLSVWKEKTPEERAEGDDAARACSHKLIPKITRHGKGMKLGDYIHVKTDFAVARVSEGPTRYGQSRKGPAASPGAQPPLHFGDDGSRR